MKRATNALPEVILAVYMATAGMAGYKPVFMRFSSISALFLIAAALYLRRKTDGPSAIDKGFLLYLTLNAIVFWAFPGRPAQLAAAFPGGLLYAVLCVVTAIPAIASKTYFTEYFAKKTTPSPVWETTVFKNINRNMTWAWAGYFCCMCPRDGRPLPGLHACQKRHDGTLSVDFTGGLDARDRCPTQQKISGLLPTQDEESNRSPTNSRRNNFIQRRKPCQINLRWWQSTAHPTAPSQIRPK